MTATLTEGATTYTLDTCRGMAPGEDCDRPVDLIIATHTATDVPVCYRCWDADRDRRLPCPVTLQRETRDQHAHVVRWVL